MIELYQDPKEEELKTPKVIIEGLDFIKIKGDKGDTGPEPTDKKLISLIEPLIPEPIPGENGEDYILTEKDKKEIASKIKVPIVEKVIEKTETIKEKNVILKDTPEEVRDKLESLIKGKKLSIQAIEGLAEILKDLSKKNVQSNEGYMKGSVHNAKSTQIKFIDDETPSGVINGINTIFTIKRVPAQGSLKLYRGGTRQRITEDYTLSGKTLTLLIAPQVGEILLVDYRIS